MSAIKVSLPVRCPSCRGVGFTVIVDERRRKTTRRNPAHIARRYACKSCKHRWTEREG